MPASYPTSAKSFTTKNTSDTIQAAHINDLQLEVTAVESDLIGGLPVSRGGTGAATHTSGELLVGAGTSAITSTASPSVTAITAATVTCTGQVVISGASAGQIVFPASQNASSNANTLDDYEEGTWTPVIGGSGGTSGQTYSFQVGWYVKVGRKVTAGFDVSASNKGTITTNAQIQGLPFTSANVSNQRASCAIGFWNTGAGGTALVACMGLLSPNETAIDIFGSGSAATTPTNLSTANFDTAVRFAGTIEYLATA